MRRQISPSKLLVPPGPQAFPQRHCLGEQTVIVNHYSGIEKAIPSLPGFRTSAAFLTSLSANLRIDPDCPSPLGTPTTFRHNSYSLHPLPPTSLTFSTLPAPHNPYPSPAETEILSSPEPIAPAKSATNHPPQLSTYTAESQDDRAQGLRLVASSVAEQRHIASKMLLLHPITLTAFTLTSILVLQYTLTAYPTNWPLAAGTLLVLLMLSLLAIRRATSPYLTLAHDIDTTWLTSDRLLVVKWGADVIGALVLGWADSDAAKKRGRRRRGKAVIRSWTVAPKYRGKGVGKSLLEEAVRVAGEKGADGILFHGEHANSKRILPTPFNRFLDTLEARAEKALTKVADEKGNFRQRQGSPTWGSR